jgi:hypothetical protein
MKKLDRIIMVVFLIGVWGLLGTIWLKPANVNAHADGHTHDSYDVYGVAEEGHSHDYAEEGHSHDYADSYHTHSHTHTCDVSGSYAECY